LLDCRNCNRSFLSLAISRILLVTTISSNSLEFEVKTIVPKFLVAPSTTENLTFQFRVQKPIKEITAESKFTIKICRCSILVPLIATFAPGNEPCPS
jgi:hypothetical protein